MKIYKVTSKSGKNVIDTNIFNSKKAAELYKTELEKYYDISCEVSTTEMYNKSDVEKWMFMQRIKNKSGRFYDFTNKK